MNTAEPRPTTLVLGASRGIGRAICQRLLASGHQVIGVARDFSASPLDHPAFTPVTLDLSRLDTLGKRFQDLQQAHPDITALVCCAGRGQFGSLEEFSHEQIRGLMELNFLSHACAARSFLPAMKRRRRGHLVFMGSEAALAGRQKGAIYCASKFALRGLAQALREECAGSGVHVSIVNPGMVKTGFFDGLDFAPGEQAHNYLLPEDVADAVQLILDAREGAVIEEINLSPLKKHVVFKKPGAR